MKPLHELTLNEQTLMPKDWLQRRMRRFVRKGQSGGQGWVPSLKLTDVAKWFGVDYKVIMHMESGVIPINDKWQVQLSQFFYLFDMGLIVLDVDMVKRTKTWRRATPVAPACKVARPRIDFTANKLTFD